MIRSVNNNDNTVYTAFKNHGDVKRGYIAYRYHTSENVDISTKLKSTAGAVLGTAIPVLYFAKKQSGKAPTLKSVLHLNYGLKEMLVTGISAIVSGAAFGMIGETRKKRDRKRKEAVFQIMNTCMPLLLVEGFLRLSNNVKVLNNRAAKLGGTIVGVVLGMIGGAHLSNKINDPKDLEPDRKLNVKDAIANVDDVVGALILAKFPFIEKLHAQKFLPVIYAWCGYRAGQSN